MKKLRPFDSYHALREHLHLGKEISFIGKRTISTLRLKQPGLAINQGEPFQIKGDHFNQIVSDSPRSIEKLLKLYWLWSPDTLGPFQSYLHENFPSAEEKLTAENTTRRTERIWLQLKGMHEALNSIPKKKAHLLVVRGNYEYQLSASDISKENYKTMILDLWEAVQDLERVIRRCFLLKETLLLSLDIYTEKSIVDEVNEAILSFSKICEDDVINSSLTFAHRACRSSGIDCEKEIKDLDLISRLKDMPESIKESLLKALREGEGMLDLKTGRRFTLNESSGYLVRDDSMTYSINWLDSDQFKDGQFEIEKKEK